MKTNEADTPWDPKPEHQKVDGRLFKDGVDQLKRDVLRFLELTPDIPMSSVRIATSMAFPMASEPSDRAMTKEDLLHENAPQLLAKIGVPEEYLSLPESFLKNPTSEDEEKFHKITSRYIGVHSKVKANILMDQGVKALELAVRGTEGGFEAQSSNPTLLKEEQLGDVRKAIARDALMKEIRKAVLVPKFGKKFQMQNGNIPLKDLKNDKERFLKQTSTKSYPLYGSSVIKAVLRAADEEIAHQGAPAIIDMLTKEKYVFFDENGIPLDQKTTVDEHVQGCTECSDVEKIRDKLPEASGHLLQIPKDMEDEVLLFADRRHQGFAAAYKRVKTWTNFPDFKQKVS